MQSLAPDHSHTHTQTLALNQTKSDISKGGF